MFYHLSFIHEQDRSELILLWHHESQVYGRAVALDCIRWCSVPNKMATESFVSIALKKTNFDNNFTS